jgi:ATP-binding cassette subfamily C protein
MLEVPAVKVLARPLLRLIWCTPGLRRGAVGCVLLFLIAAAAEIAAALTVLPVLQSVGVNTGTDFATAIGQIRPSVWLALFALVAILRSIANRLAYVQEQRGTQELIVTLQTRLYRALAQAQWDTVRRLAPTRITSALQTQTYDASYGFSSLVQLVSAVLLALGYLASVAVIFPLILPLLLFMLGLIWWTNARHSDHVLAHSEDYVEATTELHQRYEDWVAISRISSLGVDGRRLADRFESGAREAAASAVAFSRSTAATRVSYDAALVVCVVIGVPIAWWLDTPPAILAFGLIAFIRIIPRAGGVQTGYQGLVSAVAPLRAIQCLTEELERDAISSSPTEPMITWQHLELRGMGIEDTAGDSQRHWLLRDVSLELKFGEWLALTGPTGAGKTTLAEVMLTLVRTNEGEMLIDGDIVDEALANRWRDQAAYVPQDVVLFDATIRENLRLYSPHATDAELQTALERAAARFVFDRLPEGLDTRVGPGGRWLSGGERQRIGIARALLRKPGFLVLDEPTAALDSGTQIILIDALGQLEHTMSVVLITHRVELLRLVDRIIGIEDGRITRRDDGFRRNDPDPRRP